MNKLSKLAAAVSAATLAGGTQAAVINTSINLDQLLSAPAGTYTGAFALADLLSANGLAGGNVLSARVNAYGYSDSQINQVSQVGYSETLTNSYGYTVQTSCGWSGCNYAYALYRDFNANTYYLSSDTVRDTMVLSAGQGTSTGQVNLQSTGYNTNGYDYTSTRNNGTAGYDYLRHYTYSATQSYSGSLGAGYTLNATELIAMAAAGAFNFSVGALQGNFHLTQVALVLEAEAAQIQAGAQVPEPATGALMVGGLAALAAAARRRRRDGTDA
ncbi:PEP-CTERM sorting domain-containing protein [Pseudoduganella sp. LjRoot289]|uniref:PEP-CTERM sorting domain-containing protein n=1 Tax=Pseudoduganella sp. LjRoot289 TaxID=3342314 RepID=UPI003ECDC0FD